MAEVMEEFQVSRNTVKRASRDHAAALRREERGEELTALRDVDLEALVALGIEAHAEALERMLRLLRGPDGTLVVGAANAVSRLLTSLTQNLIRLGVIPDPADEALRRRIEQAERTYARALVTASDRAGLPVQDFEKAMDEAAEEALYAGGLVLAGTNGKEP